MKILYNGCYCGEKLFNTLLKEQDIPMSYAQEKLENMLLKGFDKNREIKISAVSAVPVRAYPGNKKLLWKFKEFFLFENITIKQISFINILVIKQIMLMIGSLVYSLKWCLKNIKDKNKIMLSYSANPPILLPMLFVCKLFRVKSIILVTELPKFRFFDGQNSMLRALLLKILLNVAENLHELFDGYVFLTEEMKYQINKRNKPYIVIEGMIDTEQIETVVDESVQKNVKVILYTGTLNREYGIPTLIEGFKKLGREDTELWFCGQGNFMDDIKAISEDFKRIRYLGMLSYNKVHQLQTKADFLINPRPTDEEYTKYCFPSKTLEYMLTGTPVISTKLIGIPSDYDKYLIYIEDETVIGYAEKLKEILKNNYSKYKMQAENGKEFVILNKSTQKQVMKIIEFAMKLN